MGEKMLYTITMDKAVVAKLKKYARIRKVNIGDITTCAVMDFMTKNPPTDAEIEAYKQRLAQEADVDF